MPDDTQYQRGRARLKQMLGDLGDQAVENIARISPDMANYVVEFIFGDIQSRPGLDLKTREPAALNGLYAARDVFAEHAATSTR
jgi:4-carboxymuconolactone decarboxylase